ncbi:MAG: DNA pilot protein [Microviridae sp.]|nr:MAG: DNA pilot protein [Microviridae sp.]
MGFLKKVGKFVKKAAPVALGAAGAYYGLNALGGTTNSTTITNPDNGTTGGGSGRTGWGDQALSFLKDNASSVISGGAKMLGGSIQNTSNAQQAQKQMDFQAQQSNTAHQRETADLMAAGLNPILSGTGGMGASSAQGASAQFGNVAGDAVDSYWDSQVKQQSLRKMESETNAVDAQTEQTKAATRLTDAQINEVAPRMGKTAAETALLQSQHSMTEASAKSAWVKAGLDASMSDWEKAKRIAEVFNLGASAASKVLDSILSALPTKMLTTVTRNVRIPGGTQSTRTTMP